MLLTTGADLMHSISSYGLLIWPFYREGRRLGEARTAADCHSPSHGQEVASLTSTHCVYFVQSRVKQMRLGCRPVGRVLACHVQRFTPVPHNWMWWPIPVIPALQRWRQGDQDHLQLPVNSRAVWVTQDPDKKGWVGRWPWITCLL